MKATLKTLAVCAALAVSGLAQAQDIKIANIVELSGPGTSAGTVFKNGVELAIKEINASGGILGKKISYTTEDTQTNPGVAKGLTQKGRGQRHLRHLRSRVLRLHHGLHGRIQARRNAQLHRW